MKLKDKVAVVTGGADGIGRASAKALADEGAKVVIADINEPKGKEVMEELQREGSDVWFVKCDVGSDKDIRNLIDETVSRYGKLDVLHNNAAVAIGSNITDMPDEAWHKLININLTSVFRGCKYAIPYMLKNKSGSIINTSSVQAHVVFEGWAAYAAAKGGVTTLSNNLAVQYAKYNIRVNCLSPGTIRTPMNKQILAGVDNPKELEQSWISLHPINRLGEPREVGSVVVFLASDDSSFVTGVDIRVDGGLVLRP
jgi:NAD(P)-dependent dehydrogenase (short-subunit alcohol dehydrogenase family)